VGGHDVVLYESITPAILGVDRWRRMKRKERGAAEVLIE